MRRATGLEHPDTSIALAVAFQAAQENPCVHQGGDADLGLLESRSPFDKTGKKSGDLVLLKKIDQPSQHRFDFESVAQRNVAGDWIDDDDSRFDLRCQLVHP